MRAIGQAVLDAEVARIKAGRNVRGMPAHSLTMIYAHRKLKRGAEAIRNLMLSGRTLAALKVKTATRSKVVIGTDNPVVRLILLATNRVEKMWGLSAEGRRAANAAAQQALADKEVVRFEEV